MICRNLLAAVTLIAILGLPPAFAGLSEYQDAVHAEPSLISYFTFDADSGTAAADTCTTALPNPTGALQGTATFTPTGEGFGGAGKALSLTGAGWVNFGAVAEFAFGGQSAELATPGTVEMWVRPSWDPLTPPSYNPALASVREVTPGNDPNPYTRWSMHLEKTRLGWGVFGGIMGYHPEYWNFRPDQWYHVAFVFTPNYQNNTNYPTTRVFVNGILLGDFWGYLGAKTDAPFQIGAADPNGGSAFIGLIDEVAVYSTWLSDSAIAQHYLAAVGVAPPTTPLPSRAAYGAQVMADAPTGYYSFEGDTISVTDNSGNGRHGTLVEPAKLRWTSGFGGGQALAFDNSGSSGGMVSMGAVEDFTFADGTGTVEAWVAPAPGIKYRSDNFSWPFGNYRPGIASCADDYWHPYYALEMRTSDATIGVENVPEWYVNGPIPGGLPEDEHWFHVVAVFNAGKLDYYVNGLQVINQADFQLLPPDGFLGNFQIGAIDPQGDWGFPGKIDEVAVYDAALSPERIAAHYSSVAMTFDIHEIEFLDPTNLTPVDVTLSAPSGQSSSGLELTFSYNPAIITVTVPALSLTLTPGVAYPIPDGTTSAVLRVSPVSGGYGTTMLTATPNAASGWLAGDSIQIQSSLVIVGGMYVNDHFDDNAVGTNVNGVGGGWYVPYQAKGAPSESDSSLKILNNSGWYAWTGIASKSAGEFPFMNEDGIRIEWVINYVQLTAAGGASGAPNSDGAECFHELGVISANAENNQWNELYRNTKGGLYVNLFYSGYVDSPTENITVKGSIRVVNSNHPEARSDEGANGLETPVVFELTNVHSITPAKPLVVTIELDQDGWKVGFPQNAGAVYSVWPTGTSRPGLTIDDVSGKVLGGWDANTLGAGLAGAAITNEFDNGAFLFAAFHNIVDGNGQGWIDSVKACVGCPLATDCPNPFADADGDGDVDQADFAQLQACFTGTGGGIPRGCGCLDHDGSGSIDLPDLDAFEICASGAGVPAAKACDDE